MICMEDEFWLKKVTLCEFGSFVSFWFWIEPCIDLIKKTTFLVAILYQIKHLPWIGNLFGFHFCLFPPFFIFLISYFIQHSQNYKTNITTLQTFIKWYQRMVSFGKKICFSFEICFHCYHLFSSFNLSLIARKKWKDIVTKKSKFHFFEGKEIWMHI